MHIIDPLLMVLQSGGGPYGAGEVTTHPLVSVDRQRWDTEVSMLFDVGTKALGYSDPFFRHVALKMLLAWEVYKSTPRPDNYRRAIETLSSSDTDWIVAGREWMERRLQQWMLKPKS